MPSVIISEEEIRERQTSREAGGSWLISHLAEMVAGRDVIKATLPTPVVLGDSLKRKITSDHKQTLTGNSF